MTTTGHCEIHDEEETGTEVRLSAGICLECWRQHREDIAEPGWEECDDAIAELSLWEQRA